MRITFDKKADAISLLFREGRVSKDVPISENVFAGYDREGNLIEVQILEASEMEQPWLSLEAAAKVIGKSARTLLRWIEAGEIKPPKVGRDYRFSPQLVARLGAKPEEVMKSPHKPLVKRGKSGRGRYMAVFSLEHEVFSEGMAHHVNRVNLPVSVKYARIAGAPERGPFIADGKYDVGIAVKGSSSFMGTVSSRIRCPVPRKSPSKLLKFFVGWALSFAPCAQASLCRDVFSLLPPALFQWDVTKKFAESKIELYLALKYSVLNVPEPTPAQQRLAQILTTPYKSGSLDPIADKELKARLDAWAKEFEIPFVFAFPEELPSLIKNEQGKTGLQRDGYVRPENGVLDQGSYKAAVLAGKWPILDPHDVINHLPDVSDPVWRRELIHHAQVVTQVRKLTLESLGATPADSVQEFLEGTVRSATYETHAAVFMDSKGAPRILLRGAAGLVTMEILVRGGSSSALADILVPKAFASPSREWPQFNDYLQARGDALFERQKKAAQKIGIGWDERAVALGKVQALLNSILAKDHKSLPPEERVDFILGQLAKRLHEDPLLRDVFNSANRLAALKSSLELAEDYLSWKYPK